MKPSLNKDLRKIVRSELMRVSDSSREGKGVTKNKWVFACRKVGGTAGNFSQGVRQIDARASFSS
jgi:hypothetical protein